MKLASQMPSSASLMPSNSRLELQNQHGSLLWLWVFAAGASIENGEIG